jgi:branched-chain amino acid transport system substrate-binding protein
VSKKLWIIFSVAMVVILLIGGVLAACGTKEVTPTPTPTPTPSPTPTPPTADEIVIGASRDITGPQAGFQSYGFAPIYKMWAADVNAAGGINVAGKMLPVRIIEYDDASDTAVCTRNIEKLCTQDHVNFLFGPTGTTMLFAAAPIANKYQTIIICGEGGATTLEPKLPDLPYVYSVLNYSDHFQLPVFADLMKTAGAKTAFICYIQNLHGAEYSLVAQTEFAIVGIDIVGIEGVPPSISDMDPIVKEAQASNADIFCCFCYPDQNILFMQTAISLNYSPKAILIGPGCNFGFFNDMFGANLEDVFGEGAWNRKSSAGANELADKIEASVGAAGIAAFGDKDAFMDWWGALVYYSALQFFQQSIEQAASLDNDAVREVMKTAHFETSLGEMWWDIQGSDGGGLLPQACYAGQIGQWQSGVFEVVDAGAKRTADPVYPKPPYPAK